MSDVWSRSAGVRTAHMRRRALIVRRWASLCRRRLAEDDGVPVEPEDVIELPAPEERDEREASADFDAIAGQSGFGV